MGLKNRRDRAWDSAPAGTGTPHPGARHPARCFLLLGTLLPALAWSSPAPAGGKGVAASLNPSRYNRVQGFFAGAEALVSPPGWRGLGILGMGGYGLADKAWRYEMSVLLRRPRFTLSAATFNRTASLDDSLIDARVNTLTALMVKRDYMDYYQAMDGAEITLTHSPTRRWNVNLRASMATLRNMGVATDWSVFRRDERFRANPAIREGDEGAISAGVTYDRTATPDPLARSGTRLSGTYERRFRDFENDGLRVEIRRYQVLPFGKQTLVLRGLMASRARLSPADSLHLLYLGGLGTLRGYTYREFHGNRAIMFNADYVFRNALRLIDLVVFFDTGWIAGRPATASVFSGFGDVQWADFKSDAGISLALTGHLLRFDLGRRLDRRHRGWVLTMIGGKRI